jgi:hypothetical protein
MTAGNLTCYALHREASGAAANPLQYLFAGEQWWYENRPGMRQGPVEGAVGRTICLAYGGMRAL